MKRNIQIIAILALDSIQFNTTFFYIIIYVKTSFFVFIQMCLILFNK